MTTTSHLTSRRERVPADFAAMQDYFWQQGWTDGLPVVPPTEDAVCAMLAGVNADPQHSLGVMQPSNLAGYAGEAGHQRRHGRVQAGALPRRCGGGQGGLGRVAQPCRHRGHHRRGQPGADSQRPRRAEAGHPGRRRVLRPRLPRQRRHRTRLPTHRPQRGRADAGGDGQGHPQFAGAVQLLLRRERGPKPVGAAARREGLCARRQHSLHRWHPGRLPHHGKHLRHRVRCPRHHRRQYEDCRIANYYQQATGGQVILVLCPEHAAEVAASGLQQGRRQGLRLPQRPYARGPAQGNRPLRQPHLARLD